MTQLYRVLYCSRNTIQGGPAQMQAVVDSILAISRRNNARNGLTGGLMFTDGCFAQVLEGPVEAVEETFERIQCDDRHAEITVLQAGFITARDFRDWARGFAGSDLTDPRFGHLDLAQAFAGHTGVAVELLTMLKSVVVRQTEWLAPAC